MVFHLVRRILLFYVQSTLLAISGILTPKCRSKLNDLVDNKYPIVWIKQHQLLIRLSMCVAMILLCPFYFMHTYPRAPTMVSKSAPIVPSKSTVSSASPNIMHSYFYALGEHCKDTERNVSYSNAKLEFYALQNDGKDRKCLKVLTSSLMKGNACHVITTTPSLPLPDMMFQYASLLGLAVAMGNRVPSIHMDSALETTFCLTFVDVEEILPKKLKWTIQEKVTIDSPFKDFPAETVYLEGIYQSWKNFVNVEDLVRAEYQFPPEIFKQSNRLVKHPTLTLDEIISWNSTLIGVHAVLMATILTKETLVAPEEYFPKAIHYMRRRFKGQKLTFLVTGEINWRVNELLGNQSDIFYAKSTSFNFQLALMSRCDHVIFSVDPIGWWGAWLAGGFAVYYPHRVPANSSVTFRPQDYFLPHWEALAV